MAPHAPGAIFLINLTPDKPKLTGRELSSIRSHNAYQHSHKRQTARRDEADQRLVRNQSAPRPLKPRQIDRDHHHDYSDPDHDHDQDDITSIGRRIPTDSLRSDPFDSLPVSVTEQVTQALDHYVIVIAPLYGTYLSDSPRFSNGCLDVILPNAINSRYFLHGLTAISRAMQLMERGEPAFNDRAVLFHRGQALIGVKDALDDVTDDLLPLAVLHLVSLDWRLGFDKAMQEHSHGLRRILKMRGPRPATRVSTVTQLLMTAATNRLNSGLIDKPAENSQTHSGSPSNIENERPSNETLRSWYPLTQGLEAPSIDTTPNELPIGFQNLKSCSAVSEQTLSLLRAVNDLIQQQQQHLDKALSPSVSSSSSSSSSSTTTSSSSIDEALSSPSWDLEQLIYQHSQSEKTDMLENWLCWGMLAYLFQHRSHHHTHHTHHTYHTHQNHHSHHFPNKTNNHTTPPPTRKRPHDTLSLLNTLIRRPSSRPPFDVVKKNDAHHGWDSRVRLRRDIAVWTLMSLAAASALRRRDDYATGPAGLEGPVDRAAATLLERVRELFAFGFGFGGVDSSEKRRRDRDEEWGVVRGVLAGFWAPGWLMGEWERLWMSQYGANGGRGGGERDGGEGCGLLQGLSSLA